MTSKEIDQQIGNLRSVQEITNVYQQIAAMRMRKIKDTVIQNRSFYETLSQVYMETQRVYLKTISPGNGHNYISKYVQKSNGKSIAVLLTANTGLYGSVVKDTFNLFIKEQANSKTELAVVGRLGRNWMQAANLGKPFKYFDLPDGTDSIEAGIQQIYDYISDYADISVYHGIFNSIVDQPAKATKITQKLEAKNDAAEILNFIFEPSIDKVLESFEEQLVYSFFDQSIYEASLAKFGSRMLSLDSATQNISKALTKMQFAHTKMKHRKQGRRQTELVSSMSLWK